MDTNTIKIGGLWANTDKNGNQYLTGYLGEAKLLVFVNSYHETGTTQPTHIMYLSPKSAEDAATKKPATRGTFADLPAFRRDREELGTDGDGGANDGTDFVDPFAGDDEPPTATKYLWERTFQGVHKSSARGTLPEISAQLKTKGMGVRIADMRKAADALKLSRADTQTIAVNGEWREVLAVVS